MLVQLQILSFATVLGLVKPDSGFTDGLVCYCKMQNIAFGSKGSDQHTVVVRVVQLRCQIILMILGDKMKHQGTLAVLLLDQK